MKPSKERIRELQEMYDTWNRLVNEIPSMIESAIFNETNANKLRTDADEKQAMVNKYEPELIDAGFNLPRKPPLPRYQKTFLSQAEDESQAWGEQDDVVHDSGYTESH